MIRDGTESINRQKDTKIVLELNELNFKLQEVLRSTLGRHIKDTLSIKSNLLQDILEKINKKLTHRFGININVYNLKMKDYKLSSLIMPNINSTTANIALNNIDNLFPKKKVSDAMWNLTANNNETAIFETLKDIKTSLLRDNFKIDFDRAKISGLNNSNFIINVDFLTTLLLDMTSEELTAVMLFEVGRIFAYLEYMNMTTNNTFTLVDSFINSKFISNKPPIESLKISLESVDNKRYPDTIAILNELDTFIFKTYRLNPESGNISIDYNRTGDLFVVRFGLAEELASALAKRSTSGLVKINDNKEYSAFGVRFIDTLKEIIVVILVAIIVSIFLLIGLAFLLVYIVFKAVTYIIKTVLRNVLNILANLFTNVEKNRVSFDNVTKRLDKIKLELIRELRGLESNDESKDILIENIDSVKNIINKLKDNVGTFNKYGYIPNNLDENIMLEDVIESLQENELHLLSAKFSKF